MGSQTTLAVILLHTCLYDVNGKAEHLYSTFCVLYTNHFKAFSHISHSVTCKEHHACLYLVSVHQMALPPIVVANIIAAHCSFIDPERMKG